MRTDDKIVKIKQYLDELISIMPEDFREDC